VMSGSSAAGSRSPPFTTPDEMSPHVMYSTTRVTRRGPDGQSATPGPVRQWDAPGGPPAAAAAAALRSTEADRAGARPSGARHRRRRLPGHRPRAEAITEMGSRCCPPWAW